MTPKPQFYVLFGRQYRITAEFYSEAECNRYLLMHPQEGVLAQCMLTRRIVVSRLDDLGEPINVLM